MMAEGLCAKCSRYLLIVFNFFFWVSGCALLGIGIWIRVDDQIEDFLERLNFTLPIDWVYTFAYILIGVGAFIFITGFCGCCGAVRESAWMLAAYIGCVVIILVAELVVGVYVAVERENLENLLNTELSKRIENYSEDGNNVTIDFLQKQFKCCGATNYTEYKDVKIPKMFGNKTEWVVPLSCCKSENDFDHQKCQQEANRGTSFKFLQTESCFENVLEFMYNNIVITIGVVVGIAIAEILGVICGVILCQNRTEYWDWD